MNQLKNIKKGILGNIEDDLSANIVVFLVAAKSNLGITLLSTTFLAILCSKAVFPVNFIKFK